MSSDDSLSGAMFAFVITLVCIPVFIWEWAWATQLIWEWVAVAEFGLAPVSLKGAYGIGVIFGSLSARNVVGTLTYQARVKKHLGVPDATAAENVAWAGLSLIVPPLIVAHTWFALWVLS